MRPVVLLILDGFGSREAAPDNAIAHARDAALDAACSPRAPHTTIDASELHVGLPEGQMGNSEVGHLNIGAGRVVYQDFTRIDHAIATGEFARQSGAGRGGRRRARGAANALHVLGLLSPGGVHSHERQIAAMVELAAAARRARASACTRSSTAATRRRAAPPRRSRSWTACARATRARASRRSSAATTRWTATSAGSASRPPTTCWSTASRRSPRNPPRPRSTAAYARGESDEFVQATAVVAPGARPATMADGDVVVFMNFRADRARQMTRALTDPAFAGFPRSRVPRLAAYVCLTSYGEEFARAAGGVRAADDPATASASTSRASGWRSCASPRPRNTRTSPTSSTAASRTSYPGEDRILVPSPKVATYDLKPEMSALEVTDRLVAAIAARKYDAIVCNYANGDMVGHTGNFDAAKKAVETLDACIGRVVGRRARRRRRGADHRRPRQCRDDARPGHRPAAHGAHAATACRSCTSAGRRTVAAGGALQDIAPTMLALMGLPQPPEMTGHSLVRLAPA